MADREGMAGQEPSPSTCTPLDARSLVEAVQTYRRLHRELGEEAARALADGAPLPARTRDMLHRLAHQPAAFRDRRRQMVDAIAAFWAESGATIEATALARILPALDSVPREEFVEPSIVDFAYLPNPLAIGDDQTISHPSIVGCMLLAADIGPDDHVLDVGTGCGYQAAVLASLARKVVSIEIRPLLAERAAVRLRALGIANVDVRVGDGCAGVPGHAPFDAILVAAGTAAPPPALLGQLRPGGRLVMPLGPAEEKQLVVITKGEGTVDRACTLGNARFVPLIGEASQEPSSRFDVDGLPFCFGTAVTPDVVP